MRNRLLAKSLIMILAIGSLAGCSKQAGTEQEDSSKRDSEEFVTDQQIAPDTSSEIEQVSTIDLPSQLTFLDAFKEEHIMEVHKDWPIHDYDAASFVKVDGKMTYIDDSKYTYRLGVDVSEYVTNVDWEKVKADGYEFAIPRVGYRGYGTYGNLVEDKLAAEHLKGAKEVGLDIGVYFFSQAITEEEAVEEAEFVLNFLERNGYTSDDLVMPIVFDAETIHHDDARTDNISGEQFTKNALAFCNRVEEAGYKSMIYANTMWEAYLYDLSELKSFPIWYADYEDQPQTPYEFAMWQYSGSAKVDGIYGDMDVNIEMIAK